MRLRVAVCCASKPGPALEAVLAALARERVSQPILAVAATARIDLAAEGVEVICTPLPGLAQARNAALVAGGAADVLALIEDDVIVARGWASALTAAWADAAPEIACIGGPLRVAFEGARPPWLAESLLGAFGLLDLGPEPAAVDLLQRSFHGANVSFRTDALRGVGGFWPVRGPDRAPDWFSDEHHAQRELGRAGWQARYEPGVAALRTVPGEGELKPRELVRRRWSYGRRLQRIGGSERGPQEALRLAVTAAAGASAAGARGDRERALQRIARASENVAFLAAPLLRNRDLAPVAGRTPFRARVPVTEPGRPIRRRLRRSSDRGAVILLYHRIAARSDDSLGLCVAPERFAAHVEVLRRSFDVLSLADLAAAARDGDAPPGAVAVTFDDGYVDNLQTAAPLLAAAGMPATLFAATGHVERVQPFWWDELDAVLRSARAGAARPLALALDGDIRAWMDPVAARAHLQAWVQPQPPDTVDRLVEQARDWAGLAGTRPVTSAADLPMDVSGLRSLPAATTLALGAHTRRHACLRSLSRDGQREEIEGSRDDIAQWTGRPPAGFSYPYGIPGHDFDATSRELVEQAGFDFAVANRAGLVNRRSDPYALPRHTAPDVDGPQFHAWLCKALRGG